MKKVFYVFLFAFFLFGCRVRSNMVGELNMISTRNVEQLKEPQLLAKFSGDAKAYMKRAIKDKSYKGKNINDAINYAVKQVPGGEYLMNCKIYTIRKRAKIKYFATGDVYGYPSERQVQGFAVGDAVMFRRFFKWQQAKIVALKDSNACIIETHSGKRVVIDFIDLSRSSE